jgi:hypothetical protein
MAGFGDLEGIFVNIPGPHRLLQVYDATPATSSGMGPQRHCPAP